VSVAYQPLRRMRSERFSSRGKVMLHLSLVNQHEVPDRCTFQRQQMNAGGAVREWLSLWHYQGY